MFSPLDVINSVLAEARAALPVVMPSGQPQTTHQTKANGSVVTAVDLALSACIKAGLQQRLDMAHNQLLDEEDFEAGSGSLRGRMPAWAAATTLWVSDPLAGTTAYMNGLPFYAITLGAMRQGRPVAGGICFPALGETYASDAVDIFRNGEIILPSVALPPQDCVYHHGPRVLQNHYDLAQAFKVVVQLPVINTGLLWVALRRVSAGFFHPYVWDLVAAWPLLKACHISIYDTVSGAALETLDATWLTPELRFKNLLLVCDASVRDAMLERLRVCARSTTVAPS